MLFASGYTPAPRPMLSGGLGLSGDDTALARWLVSSQCYRVPKDQQEECKRVAQTGSTREIMDWIAGGAGAALCTATGFSYLAPVCAGFFKSSYTAVIDLYKPSPGYKSVTADVMAILWAGKAYELAPMSKRDSFGRIASEWTPAGCSGAACRPAAGTQHGIIIKNNGTYLVRWITDDAGKMRMELGQRVNDGVPHIQDKWPDGLSVTRPARFATLRTYEQARYLAENAAQCGLPPRDWSKARKVYDCLNTWIQEHQFMFFPPPGSKTPQMALPLIPGEPPDPGDPTQPLQLTSVTRFDTSRFTRGGGTTPGSVPVPASRYPAGSIARFNTTRGVWVIYAPTTGVHGLAAAASVVPPPPAGFAPVGEQAAQPTDVPPAGEERDAKWYDPMPVKVGLAVGGGLIIGAVAWKLKRRRAA